MLSTVSQKHTISAAVQSISRCGIVRTGESVVDSDLAHDEGVADE